MGLVPLPNGFSNTLDYCDKSLIAIAPFGDRQTILGQQKKLCERCALQIDWTKNDRNNTCISTFMVLQCSLHFAAVTII